MTDNKEMKPLASIRIPVTQSDKMCPKHHINLVYFKKDQQPFCQKCVVEELEAEKTKQVEKFKVNSVKNFLKHNSLVDDSTEFNCSFSNFKADKGSKEAQMGNQAFKIADEYIKNRNKPMTTLLYGQPGEGKTHLAMSMIKKINEESNPPQKCLFIDINSLFTNIKRSFDDKTIRWNEYYSIKLLSTADVLVIDDLGSESAMRTNSFNEASDFKQEILKEILDKQKRLIITTNLSANQLKQVYNAKLFSRLLSHSNNRRLDFTGIKDKRLEME